MKEDDIAVQDIDGNIYNTVTIGKQVWMKENLKTTRYSNGDIIGTTTPATLDIWGETTPKYQWACNDNEDYVAIFGRLYTWYAATDSRNVCPTAWHVPSKDEWKTLIDYLTNKHYGYGGSGDDIAKSMAATSGWTLSGTAGAVGNDQASNNSSGFSARPSGMRFLSGSNTVTGGQCFWWSSSEVSNVHSLTPEVPPPCAYGIEMSYNSSFIYAYYSNTTIRLNGLSVRCMRSF
jgi:uncharacterized protein (TIGR02145 family)